MDAPTHGSRATTYLCTVQDSYIEPSIYVSHLRLEVFTEKARKLLFEEVQARIAKIDAELRALGIDPELDSDIDPDDVDLDEPEE
jgi:hypothetical protein